MEKKEELEKEIIRAMLLLPVISPGTAKEGKGEFFEIKMGACSCKITKEQIPSKPVNHPAVYVLAVAGFNSEAQKQAIAWFESFLGPAKEKFAVCGTDFAFWIASKADRKLKLKLKLSG